jgi:Tfp pilus assembly protein PilZ
MSAICTGKQLNKHENKKRNRRKVETEIGTKYKIEQYTADHLVQK